MLGLFNSVYHFFKVLGLSFYEIFRGNYTYTASALAFISLFSFIPILSVSIYIFSFSPRFLQIVTGIQNFLLTNFLPESIAVLNTQLHVFIHNATKLSFISVVFLFISGLTLFITLRQALNEIWKKSNVVPKKDISPLLYWFILFFVVIFFGVNIVLGSYLFSLPKVVQITHLFGVLKTSLSLLSLIINTLMFSFLYLFIPHYKIKYREGFAGGFVAAILFESAKIGFGYYIKAFSSYGVIYGAFAIVPIFLFWMYLSWLILLFGAVFAYIKSQRRFLER